MSPMRNRFFNLFYGTHQLYIVLFAFYVWHVGKGNIGKCMGGIFLFFIDRFLRMVQSRKRLTGVSAQVLPSGIVELKIPIKQGMLLNQLTQYYIATHPWLIPMRFIVVFPIRILKRGVAICRVRVQRIELRVYQRTRDFSPRMAPL